MNTKFLDKLSFTSLLITVLLLPIFSLPFTTIPVETSKGLLLVIGLALTLVFYAVTRFGEGDIVFPKSSLFLAGAAVVVVFLLSALFSIAPEAALFGSILDPGSFWFIFAAFVLMYMSATIFGTPKRAKVLLLGTIFSSAFVLVFQSLHLWKPALLSLGILSGNTGNIFGSWNALGIFTGFSTLLCLLFVEFFPIRKSEKIFLQILMLLSLLLSATVNFPLVWILLGISSLIIFVYKASVSLQSGAEGGHKFPAASFIVAIVSLLFFTAGPFVGNFIVNRLHISNAEVSPSFVSTAEVGKGVIMNHPLLGLGPNRFTEAWAMYKPLSINQTYFWDVAFSSGSGTLPTMAATTGILGILSLLIFFGLFLSKGIKSVFWSIRNSANWETMAFFVLSLYLFVSLFFYSAGAVVLLWAFAFTGVFAGLWAQSSGKVAKIIFLNDHRKSFFSISALLILVLLSFAATFKYIERFASLVYFGKSVMATTEEVAESNIQKALSLYTNDLYLRAYSQVYLAKLNNQAQKNPNPSEQDKASIQDSFNQAVTGAKMAAQYDPGNYLNYQSLGAIYQALGSLGVKDGYANAVLAYKEAAARNPGNPGLDLAIAGAYFLDNSPKDATDYAKKALELKPDYEDALLTLAQISKSQGDVDTAVSYGNQALALDPANPDLVKYVNSLSSSQTNTPPPSTSTEKTKKKQ